MKKIIVAGLALITFLAITAQARESYTVVDTSGRKVELNWPLKRIITSPVVVPNLIFAVDGTGEKMAGMHPMSKSAWENSVLRIMAPEMEKAITGFIQGGFKMNIEEVVKLKPDVVFQVSFEESDIKQLESLGIPVIVTHEGLKELDAYLITHINLVGRVLRKEDRAAELIADFEQAKATIGTRSARIPATDRPRALILFTVEELMATGTGSFANFWLGTTGADNVATGLMTSPRGTKVNMEQIMAWNPEIIYITNFCSTQPEDLIQNRVPGQDWRGVAAVQKGRVYKIPLGQYRWYPPSGDSSLMLKWMAQKNHPDVFNYYDIRAEIKKHFTRTYRFELSEAQVDRILNPVSTGSWREN
jgi:iron complex transport system substrate-binding protein